jgi:hypothetical protein
VLIVHIGTHKTGTSSLQSFLSRAGERLEANGIRYLQSARRAGKAHHELPWSVRGKNNASASVWDEVRRELEANRGKKNVVSSEGFWFADPADVRQHMGEIGDVRIVAYLRRQDKYLQSLYKQAVMGGRRTPFAEWLRFNQDRGDYLSVIENWANQFGHSAIHIRPYERDGRTIDVVEDFAHFLGIDTGRTEAQRRRRGGQNPSPRREVLAFIRAFNALDFNVDRDKLLHFLVRRNADYVRSLDLLTAAECSAIVSRFAEGNRKLSERYGSDDLGPLFPANTSASPPELWPVESEAYTSMIADVLDVLIGLALDGEVTRGKKKGKRNLPAG